MDKNPHSFSYSNLIQHLLTLQVTDMPFKIEQCDQMSEDLLNALVIPVLSQQEVLQRFNYDFTTEDTVLSGGVR